MTKGSSTRDAALSRLFGSDEEESDQRVALNDSSSAGRKVLPPGETAKAPSSASASIERGALEDSPGTEEATVSDAETKPQTNEEETGVSSIRESGYLGLGRYAREDGIVERITPYIRPDQAEALRVSVARKRDPRGKDISQIIQSLLDEAGYRGPAE